MASSDLARWNEDILQPALECLTGKIHSVAGLQLSNLYTLRIPKRAYRKDQHTITPPAELHPTNQNTFCVRILLAYVQTTPDSILLLVFIPMRAKNVKSDAMYAL